LYRLRDIATYWSKGYLDFSFLCTFVPGNKKSTDGTDGTFVPTELSFPETFAPVDQKVQELLLHGTFVPVELLLPYLKNWEKPLQQSVRRRILAMVVGLRARQDVQLANNAIHG